MKACGAMVAGGLNPGGWVRLERMCWRGVLPTQGLSHAVSKAAMIGCKRALDDESPAPHAPLRHDQSPGGKSPNRQNTRKPICFRGIQSRRLLQRSLFFPVRCYGVSLVYDCDLLEISPRNLMAASFAQFLHLWTPGAIVVPRHSPQRPVAGIGCVSSMPTAAITFRSASRSSLISPAALRTSHPAPFGQSFSQRQH